MNKHLVKPALIAVVSAMLVSGSEQASAQQPTFPFLQDGPHRDRFVRGATEECVKTGTDANPDASQDIIVKYCNCTARAMADAMNSDEYEAMKSGQAPQSVLKKAEKANALCRGQKGA
ncbi:MAG TPA: hypothetical protein VFW22_07265 [Pseudolabrys sp.]|nr:hypothetical protein [Pseudolabrys sp.]